MLGDVVRTERLVLRPIDRPGRGCAMLPRYMNPATYTPDELLGQLNAVERKHAPKQLYLEAVNLPSGAV